MSTLTMRLISRWLSRSVNKSLYYCLSRHSKIFKILIISLQISVGVFVQTSLYLEVHNPCSSWSLDVFSSSFPEFTRRETSLAIALNGSRLHDLPDPVFNVRPRCLDFLFFSFPMRPAFILNSLSDTPSN